MTSRLFTIVSLLTTSTLLSTAAAAADSPSNVNPNSSKYKNDMPITITGTITSSTSDAFTLDYGNNNTIVIEMDDWDDYDEANLLNEGEKVTVFGDIDHDKFESRKIEAGSVYAHERNTYFFADDADEEDRRTSAYFLHPTKISQASELADGAWISATGIVKSIDDREFTLDYGKYSIDVDTDELAYNPFSGESPRNNAIKVGDKVYVSGTFDESLFDSDEIEADYLVTLMTKSSRAK